MKGLHYLVLSRDTSFTFMARLKISQPHFPTNYHDFNISKKMFLPNDVYVCADLLLETTHSSHHYMYKSKPKATSIL